MKFTSFHVDSQHPQSNLKVISTAPAQHTSRNSYPRPLYAAYRACDDDTVVTLRDDVNIFCHTNGLSSSDSGVNSVTALLNIKNIASREFSLSPIAGRLCYVDRETCDVRVIDFFPPPRRAHAWGLFNPDSQLNKYLVRIL